ncbi:MAG: D-alanine--D-alanine ligase, partial [Mariprofundaceae bacterium]|nr:D-alanine--D-alanine ligase [Mariprofundaceae bacterium]
DVQEDWPRQIREADIRTAMLALHGWLGEDGCVQGMLEIMRIAYTGSGVRSTSLCMHKHLCKVILREARLAVPVDIPIGEGGPIRYPVVLKPVSQGSSIGLRFIHSPQEWAALSIDRPSDWMAEMPVKGIEVAVSVLNGHALPPVEVAPHSGVYDYSAKYTHGATEYFCPARLPAETLRLCMQRAEQAIEALGCSGAPRVDMIVADGGEPYILEINTIPGMTETSLLPKAAAAAGISFDDLCLRILETASLKSQETRSC